MISPHSTNIFKKLKDDQNTNYYISENILNKSKNNLNNVHELSNNFRFTRFSNPVISYDYKTGNYVGI
jgi:hypothetical protein